MWHSLIYVETMKLIEMEKYAYCAYYERKQMFNTMLPIYRITDGD